MSNLFDLHPTLGSTPDLAGLAVYTDRLVPYDDGLKAQVLLQSERFADHIPDALLLLQHPPVITLGRRGREDGLRTERALLTRLGIDIRHASRGGDITYHAPGQWILYPVLKLGSREADAHGYLFNLEEVAIRTASDFGVCAFRRQGKSGAWTASGKIAAIGFHLKHWITQHGMSFNVNLDLLGFEHIIPCGLPGEPVASLLSLLESECPALDRVGEALVSHFQAVFGRKLLPIRNARDLPAPLRELGSILFRNSNDKELDPLR